MRNKQMIIIFVVLKQISNTMNKKELVKQWRTQLTEVELKLKMVSFLSRNGAKVDEDELNALLDRMQTLKKLIDELEK